MFDARNRRKRTKKIRIGDIYIGGDSPITVQSMTCTKTYDIKSTLKQIHALEKEGCEIIHLVKQIETVMYPYNWYFNDGTPMFKSY